MTTILITGGTGLVGKALGRALLQKGYQVIILSRNTAKESTVPGLSFALWDPQKQTIDKEAIARADYIIHLAGAGVADKRWTKKRKEEIINSRVESSRLVAESLKIIPHKIKAVISASAIGWYGADPSIPNPSPFKENAPADSAFLGHTCRLWEESIRPVAELGMRLVTLRIGIVLSKEGGALKEFLKPVKFGLAAILANGKQMMSWIHIDDLVNMFIMAIENDTLAGIYNAVAPHPVSNKELTIALAGTKRKFFIPLHIPSFIIKIMLGEMSVEILKSATVSSQKIEATGFSFLYPSIIPALEQV